MAKSLAGIAVAQWEASGKLPSLDVPTAQHVPALQGTLRGAFSLAGTYGQMLAVYPQQGLVILHLAVNTAAGITGTPLMAERNALLAALRRHFTIPPPRAGASVSANELSAARPGLPAPP